MNRSTVMKMCRFRAFSASNFFLYVRIVSLKSSLIISRSRRSFLIKFLNDMISILMLEKMSWIDLIDSSDFTSLIRFTYSSISSLLIMKLTIMIHSSQSNDLTSTTIVLLEVKFERDIFSSSYEVKMKTKRSIKKSLNK